MSGRWLYRSGRCFPACRPAAWARPGAVTKLTDIATEFGPLSMEFRVAKNGATAELRLRPPAPAAVAASSTAASAASPTASERSRSRRSTARK